MIPYPTDHDDPGAATAHGRARAVVDPVLRACLHTLPEAVRVVCAYQLGWGDRTGAPTGRGTGAGRAIGPALVLAAARAVGGPEEAALPAAAAVELVHQSTLLHAGVTGRAPGARRRPPTRAVFGTTGAGAAGDAMAALAVRLVAGRPEAVTLLCDRLIELCGARAARHAAGPAAALPGPGALFGLACALGAIHAGAPPRVTAALDAFGRAMGTPTPAPRAAPLPRLTPTAPPAPAPRLAPTALPTPATRLAPASPVAPVAPVAPTAPPTPRTPPTPVSLAALRAPSAPSAASAAASPSPPAAPSAPETRLAPAAPSTPSAGLTQATSPAPAARLAPVAPVSPSAPSALSAPSTPPTPSAPAAGTRPPAGARYTAPAGPGTPLEQLARVLPGPAGVAELVALYRLITRTDP
ncbi:hypothetical protein Sros01_29380 [Streptomyces roseochromogenus]|nr:hypothetical protein Sros01_29380 [Streptomyces roseochromogenus]